MKVGGHVPNLIFDGWPWDLNKTVKYGPLSKMGWTNFWTMVYFQSCGLSTFNLNHTNGYKKFAIAKILNEMIWKLKTMILNYFLKLNFYIFFWGEMKETRLWTSQASWNRDSDRNIIHFRYDRISFELFKRLRLKSSDSKIIPEVA